MKGTVFFHGKDHILRTARREPALFTNYIWAVRLVAPYEPNQYIGYTLIHIGFV
jgi:hypothetical protein